MRRLASRLAASTAFRLFAAAFVVYNLNLRSVTSADTNPTRYIPISILQELDLDLDEFDFLLRYRSDRSSAEGTPYFLSRIDGHYLSSYPVLPGILSTPVYAIPVALGLTAGPSGGAGFSQTEVVGTFLSKISASLAVALSVALVYLSLIRLTDPRAALVISLLYAFATGSWSSSSQGLWQTSFSQPFLALALYAFVRARENPRYVSLAGLALAGSVACRPPNIVFAGVFFVYVLHRHRDHLGRFLIGPACVAVPLLAYNLFYFGSVIGGYTAQGTLGGEAVGADLGAPKLMPLLALLFSPSRGILVYSPFLLFSFVAAGLVLYRRDNWLLTYSAVATLLLFLLYSGFDAWHGAFSYGYRFLVDALPALSLLLAVVYGEIVRRRWAARAFATLAAFSVMVQLIGAFNYPCDWYESPRRAIHSPDRFWDWRDPEFVRCLRAGPVDPDGLRYIRDVIARR